jgi:hypothetical protein
MPLGLLVAIVAAVVVGCQSEPSAGRRRGGPRLALLGQAALAVASLLVVPGFLLTVVTIVAGGVPLLVEKRVDAGSR